MPANKSSDLEKIIEDHNPNPVLRITGEGIIDYANPAGKRILKALNITIGGKVPANWLPSIEKVVREKESVQLDYNVNHLIYLITIVPGSTLDYLYVFGTDITTQKLTQEKLKESDERFRLLAEFAQDIISRVDENGIILYVSPSAEKVLGYSFEELVGKSGFDFVSAEDQTRFELMLKDSEDTQGTLVFQTIKKDGTWIWIETKYNRFYNARYHSNEYVLVSREVTDRINAEQKLLENEERFMNLLSATSEGIVFHKDGIILDANDHVEALLGYKVDELKGKNIFNFFPQEEHQQIEDRLNGLITQPYEHHFKRRDGTSSILEFHGKNHYYKGESARAVIIRDISGWKMVEERLHESEQKYRSLVETGQDFYYTADLHGNFTYMNPVGLKQIGMTESQLLGKNFKELVRDDWKEKVTQFYENVFKNKVIDSYFEFPLVSTGQEESWVGQNVHMILSKNWITGFQAYARDVSERRKAEEEVKKQQELIESILDNLPFNIFLKDSSNNYIFVNKHFLEFFNLQKKEVLGKSAESFSSSELLKTITPGDHQAWANQFYLGEECITLSNNQIYLMVGKLILNISSYKEPVLLGYALDITSRKNAENELLKTTDQLEESVRAKEKFISIMSHEIRTPMNAVIGITNLLQQQEHSKEQNEYFNALKISSENLLKILNNVLDLSKIESGKITFEEIEFDLNESLKQVKELFSFSASEKHITIETEVDSDIPKIIQGDPYRLNQVLANLMSNAIKFTEEGIIKLSVKKIEEKEDTIHVNFSVKDSGIGISPDKVTTIFESFTQADKDITRKYGGTGLGLTITKKLVELMGGKINVQSKMGEGSVFSFDLWYSKSSKPNTKRRISESWNNNLAGLKSLVVEDNKMNQMIVTRFLEKEDIQADVVDNGLKAIEYLKSNTYDIVLMDLQMPEMDGFETSEYIRKKLKITDLPIVAFTASSSSDIENKVLEAGMNDYIVKPFEPSSFYSIIAKHTGREGSKGNIKPEAMTTSRKLTDLTYLKDASSGNQAFINEMIDIFLKQTPLYLDQLFQFCEIKDWTEFRKVMHKLKPTITMMGIKEGEELVKQIEKKVKGLTDLHTVKPSMEELKEICEGSFVELKDEIIR